MSATIEINLGQLLAEAHEGGRERGYDSGYQDGRASAQSDLVERLRKLRSERSGSRFDVGLNVVDEAIRRCSANVADITPSKAKEIAPWRFATSIGMDEGKATWVDPGSEETEEGSWLEIHAPDEGGVMIAVGRPDDDDDSCRAVIIPLEAFEAMVSHALGEGVRRG